MITFTITKGDTRTPLGATLQQRNTAGVLQDIDVTSLTLSFRMVNDAGTIIVSAGTVVKEDATNGEVSYDFQDADVATAGIFWAWFVITESSQTDHFPRDGRTYRILIKDNA